MTYAFIAAAAVVLVSMTGIVLFRTKGRIQGTHRFILPAAVGVFLGIVFLELVPETLAAAPEHGMLAVLAGFLGFYLLSHLLATFHHHHHDHADGCVHERAHLLLLGDAVHNIADGIVIAGAFLIDPVVGIATTIGVILHELPQEIAEFGVLVASGYSRGKALVLNLISASSVFLGVMLMALFAEHAEGYIWLVTGVAAGNLLYLATSDFIPELRENHGHKFATTFLTTLAGLALVFVTLAYAHSFMEESHDHEREEAPEGMSADELHEYYHEHDIAH